MVLAITGFTRIMNLLLPVMAGCFCALGGVCTKLSGTFQSGNEVGNDIYYYLLLVLFMGLMIACNVIGLFLFTQCLSDVDSSVVATLASTGCNYVLSGLFGALLFGETVSVYWQVGTVFVILGLLLISED